jgi:phosphoglycerate dehydrogenase-like enzyme
MARRGPIVDDAALLSHLRTKQIAGAGLNGYDVEPLPADYPVQHDPAGMIPSA